MNETIYCVCGHAIHVNWRYRDGMIRCNFICPSCKENGYIEKDFVSTIINRIDDIEILILGLYKFLGVNKGGNHD